MATAGDKSRCITCNKGKGLVRCEGCLKIFCFNHLNDHHQGFSKQLDEIETNHDLFRQKLTERINHPIQQTLIEQIHQWEKDSIDKIKQTAGVYKNLLFQHTNEHFKQLETDLNNLTNQLKETRQENNYNEVDLIRFKDLLTQLAKELETLPSISIQQDPTSLINKISVVRSSRQSNPSTHISVNTKWKQNGIIIAGGNEKGSQLNQLSCPQGICVDDDEQCIYIADTDNHRIMKWGFDAKNGIVVAGGNGKGNRRDRLDSPTDIILDKKNDSLIIFDKGNERIVRWPLQNGTSGETIRSLINCCTLIIDSDGDFYASDYARNEVKRWRRGDMNPIIVAGGNGKGDDFNQLNGPTYIFIDQDRSVFVSDKNNHRVMKWMKDAKEGIVIAGGSDPGNSLEQLNCPQGIVVDLLGNVYVADTRNHRIMCWSKGSKQGNIVVGESENGNKPNQVFYPSRLSFDRQGNIYVVDTTNSRVQKFEIDAN